MGGWEQQQFMQEVYACLCPLVEVPGVDDNNLNIFTHDILFNFAVKQAMDQLDDPGALAEVAQLWTFSAHIPVYSELIQAV